MFWTSCRDGSFPSELGLGVSREAISVYKRGEPWPLEVFRYEQILSFGAPLASAYKIAVEGRELVFDTQMVMDIAKLMKAYISMIGGIFTAAMTAMAVVAPRFGRNAPQIICLTPTSRGRVRYTVFGDKGGLA
ncbi:Unconventional myosin-X [Dissostichus eleginoides]|nr:Unconventional myosin-X [Dissostichus eleginoides]